MSTVDTKAEVQMLSPDGCVDEGYWNCINTGFEGLKVRRKEMGEKRIP